MVRRSYRPFVPARRPGGQPSEKPRYRVLVHQRRRQRWEDLPRRTGLENAQQFWDHVAQTPAQPPAVGRSSFLRGKAGKPRKPGFSRTVHYEITGAGRIDYQHVEDYVTGPGGDPHGVVFILDIDLSSH